MEGKQPYEPRHFGVGSESKADVEVQGGNRVGQIRHCGQAGTLG